MNWDKIKDITISTKVNGMDLKDATDWKFGDFIKEHKEYDAATPKQAYDNLEMALSHTNSVPTTITGVPAADMSWVYYREAIMKSMGLIKENYLQKETMLKAIKGYLRN
jgi:hypothetical protein